MSFDPATALLDIGAKLVDRLFPDPAKKSEAMLKLMELQQSGDLAAIASQTQINQIEAASPKLFVSGWRPAVGWVCVLGLFTQFLLRPLTIFTAGLFGRVVSFPELDMGTLMTLLAGMLGLSGLRTFEKINGVAAK